MPTIIMEGYSYGSSGPFGIMLSWYVYNGVFTSPGVSSYGRWKPPIKLAVENSKVVIFINDKQYYVRFGIRAYAYGMGEPYSWFQGWTTADEAISGTATNVTDVNYTNNFGTVYVDNLNVGATTIIDSNGKIPWAQLNDVPVSSTTVSGIVQLTDSTSSTSTTTAATPNSVKTAYDLANGKEPKITAGTTSQYWRGDKSWQTLDKTAVALGNVPNVNFQNSWTMNDATYLATDEIRARDSAGLKLSDDSGTAGLFVEDGGFVGVGTTNPWTRLDISTASTPWVATKVSCSGAVQALYSGQVTTNYAYIGDSYYYTSLKWRTGTTYGSAIRFLSTGMSIFSDSGLTADTDYTPTERVTILTSGNVGIATTSPTEKLHVTGNIKATGTLNIGAITCGAITSSGAISSTGLTIGSNLSIGSTGTMTSAVITTLCGGTTGGATLTLYGSSNATKGAVNLNSTSLQALSTGVLKSTVATGTAPFIVSSSTQVDLLNAQYIGGKEAYQFADAQTGQYIAGYGVVSGGEVTNVSTALKVNISAGSIMSYDKGLCSLRESPGTAISETTGYQFPLDAYKHATGTPARWVVIFAYGTTGENFTTGVIDCVEYTSGTSLLSVPDDKKPIILAVVRVGEGESVVIGVQDIFPYRQWMPIRYDSVGTTPTKCVTLMTRENKFNSNDSNGTYGMTTSASPHTAHAAKLDSDGNLALLGGLITNNDGTKNYMDVCTEINTVKTQLVNGSTGYGAFELKHEHKTDNLTSQISGGTLFELTYVPDLESLMVFKNGLYMTQGVDYTYSESTPRYITMSFVPVSGDILVASYAVKR
jgi:hypothetical protein